MTRHEHAEQTIAEALAGAKVADDITNAKIAVQLLPGATSPPTAAQLVAQQAALEAAKAAAIERLQAEAHELVASTDARLKEIAEELKALGHRRAGRPKTVDASGGGQQM